LIVGLGNPMMADDGIGHGVIRGLESCELPPRIRLSAVDGDVLALASLWEGEAAIWLVDAVSGGSPAGTLRVFEHQEILRLPGTSISSHHLSPGEGLRWMLHSRPDMATVSFRLFGIEAGIVRPGQGLSPEVEGTMASLVDVVRGAARDWVSAPGP
jgi:hydrogenase maturation protease